MSHRSLRRARRLLPVVLNQIDAFIALSNDPERMDRRQETVSKWSVGQHVEHLALAHSGVVSRFGGLMDGSVTDRGGPNLIGHVALAVGRLPRGRGKAPEATKPRSIDHDEITQRLSGMRERLARLEPDLARLAASPATFEHPVFGALNAAQWLRFLDVHHRHHGRIIREIEAR